jgi:phosphatidylglycerol---prolipoprotein diacylglyceryl transferase
VPIAIVTFRFDPYAHLSGDVTIRWATIALVLVIVASLVLAGLLARAASLRPDDIAFVAVGTVPGAVIGGRLGYLLLHQAYFGSAPERLLDPSIGGMELGLAVAGGFLTGSYVASLLGAPVGRWLHVAAIPVLFALGAGKLTMLLSGTGQGQPSDAAWATAYLGAGPWGSLVPTLSSVPSQTLEGLATLGILVIVTVALMLGAFRRRDGRLFFLAVGLWAAARVLASTTWRDPVALGGLNAGGAIAAGIAVACALALILVGIRGRREVEDARSGDPGVSVAWPDPDVRPPF